MTNAIDLQLVADYGGTNLWPMIALSNIAQASAVMGVIWLHRGDEKRKSCLCTSGNFSLPWCH